MQKIMYFCNHLFLPWRMGREASDTCLKRRNKTDRYDKIQPMKKSNTTIRIALATTAMLLFCCCGGSINTNHDPRFDEAGYLLNDSIQPFRPEPPAAIKFYVEVSGSMNGFFRPNKPTQFKTDVWNVLSYYKSLNPTVYTLTNDGIHGKPLTSSQFQTHMNAGAFVSTASTKVPEMIKTIIKSLNADSGEVAVLISDMKYSPVGEAAKEVRMAQYSTDISNIIEESDMATCLICTTSDYLDKKGNEIEQRSPYYYYIIGKGEQVVETRNTISALLDRTGHFVDNIENGIDYGKPTYSFGIPRKCEQLDGQPTFLYYEDADRDDTCTIRLKICLDNYRWLLHDEDNLAQAFDIETVYGSEVTVGAITINKKETSGKNPTQETTATIELKLSHMALDSEVLSWAINIPHKDHSRMKAFLEDAEKEEDVSKSYSVLEFINGMFLYEPSHKQTEKNYILISRKG